MGETTAAGELCAATASRATGLCSRYLQLTNPDPSPTPPPAARMCRQNPGQPSRASTCPTQPQLTFGLHAVRPEFLPQGTSCFWCLGGFLPGSPKSGGEVSPPLQKWSEGLAGLEVGLGSTRDPCGADPADDGKGRCMLWGGFHRTPCH